MATHNGKIKREICWSFEIIVASRCPDAFHRRCNLHSLKNKHVSAYHRATLYNGRETMARDVKVCVGGDEIQEKRD